VSNTQPSIFLGLVTYPGTRFPESSTKHGLLQKLASELLVLKIIPTVAIEGRNLANERGVSFAQNDVNESIRAELNIESRWRAYIDPKKSKLSLKLFMSVRTLYRRVKFRQSNGQHMLNRLANIELAHLSLLQTALDSNSDWVLVIEDDARSTNVKDLAANLSNFIQTQEPERKPKYVNLSKSFSNSNLKTTGLLSPVSRWNQSEVKQVQIYSSSKPFSNTVCAILYRRTFLVDLVDQLNQIPLKPVLPIDWKLNSALLAMTESHKLGDGDFWAVEPGPIVQGSMFNS